MSTKSTLFYASDEDGMVHIYRDVMDNYVYLEVEKVNLELRTLRRKIKFGEADSNKLLKLAEELEAKP